eukprot:13824799-Alexandrium_andersonii.AAC.1
MAPHTCTLYVRRVTANESWSVILAGWGTLGCASAPLRITPKADPYADARASASRAGAPVEVIWPPMCL